MRILHTADWHLGRIFHGRHLTQDQAHVLEQFCTLARDVRPDAIIIAGDVFDRAVPPPEAVELFGETLARLVQETTAHLVIIGGNHDSAVRLGFAAPLLQAARVHLRTRFVADPAPVIIDDAHGPVHLFPLPYADPAQARSTCGDDSLREHADVFTLLLNNVRCRLARSGNPRSIITAHATVLGGESSESERPLSIGGAEAVPPALFHGFGYVALGHLHRPQWIGGNARANAGGAGDAGKAAEDTTLPSSRIRYAGSLLKYSFSEADHRKSISLLELDAASNVRLEEITLTPLHDVRRISGRLEELLARAKTDPAPDDYLLAEITDEGPVLDALERLRDAWPNVLRLERPWLTRMVQQRAASVDHARITPLQMLEAFHRDMTGEPLSDSRRALLQDILDDILRSQREASA